MGGAGGADSVWDRDRLQACVLEGVDPSTKTPQLCFPSTTPTTGAIQAVRGLQLTLDNFQDSPLRWLFSAHCEQSTHQSSRR